MVTFQMSHQGTHYERSRVRFVDIIADIGGLWKVIMLVAMGAYKFFSAKANMLHLAIHY